MLLHLNFSLPSHIQDLNHDLARIHVHLAEAVEASADVAERRCSARLAVHVPAVESG